MLNCLNLHRLNPGFFALILILLCFTISHSEEKSRYSVKEFLHCDNDKDISYTLALTATPVDPVVNNIITENPGEIWLRWTATGDDGLEGIAAGYDIRYRAAQYGPINSDFRWRNAVQVDGEPAPSQCGLCDSMLITGLIPGESYYFCIKAYDDCGNYSGLSNSPLKSSPSAGLTLQVNTSGEGSVLVSPFKETYNQDEVVFLQAQPDSGSVFSRWSGSVNSVYNPILIVVSNNYIITANFVTIGDFIPGDANGDGQLINGDVTYLIQYFRGAGPTPVPYLAGDCNGDCSVVGGDVTYLINYFRGMGPEPIRGDCGDVTLSVDNLPVRPSSR